MTIKKEKREKKNKKFQLRIAEKEINKAQIRADLYFEGNLSDYFRYCIQNPSLRNIKEWNGNKKGR